MRELRIQVLDIQDAHCTNCEAREEVSQTYIGKKRHIMLGKLCLRECEIGKEMQKIGRRLS